MLLSCKEEGTIETNCVNTKIFSDNYETGQLIGWSGIDSESIISTGDNNNALKLDSSAARDAYFKLVFSMKSNAFISFLARSNNGEKGKCKILVRKGTYGYPGQESIFNVDNIDRWIYYRTAGPLRLEKWDTLYLKPEISGDYYMLIDDFLIQEAE